MYAKLSNKINKILFIFLGEGEREREIGRERKRAKGQISIIFKGELMSKPNFT